MCQERHTQTLAAEGRVQDEPRHDSAIRLLMLMLTRSWNHFIHFSRVLSETIGIADLGEKLLHEAESGSSLVLYQEIMLIREFPSTFSI